MVKAEGGGFGERLRQLREAAGLTQQELATKAGLTAKGIAAVGRGRRQRPYYPNTIAARADAWETLAPWSPSDRTIYCPHLAALRAQLDAAQFAADREQGAR